MFHNLSVLQTVLGAAVFCKKKKKKKKKKMHQAFDFALVMLLCTQAK
jgi:uncharacterized membrane protein SirB2